MKGPRHPFRFGVQTLFTPEFPASPARKPQSPHASQATQTTKNITHPLGFGIRRGCVTRGGDVRSRPSSSDAADYSDRDSAEKRCRPGETGPDNLPEKLSEKLPDNLIGFASICESMGRTKSDNHHVTIIQGERRL
jgi:hypothetical protein